MQEARGDPQHLTCPGMANLAEGSEAGKAVAWHLPETSVERNANMLRIPKAAMISDWLRNKDVTFLSQYGEVTHRTWIFMECQRIPWGVLVTRGSLIGLADNRMLTDDLQA